MNNIFPNLINNVYKTLKMRIIYHLFLSVVLFFVLFWNYWFASPLEWSGSTISEENNYWEKLSFDTKEKTQEVELKSAEEKDDKQKTIKELKSNIAELHSDKKHITKNFNAFIFQNGSLRKYFKRELNNNELDQVEKIIIDYNSLRFKTESLLKNKAHQLEDTSIVTSDLLSLKKDLYISFLPYIEISQLGEYKVFIKADFEATKQDKNIQSDIYKKEKIVEEKKIIIQEKIQASELSLEEKRNRFIENKIKAKLFTYSRSPKFQSLTIDKQKFVFGKVLTKIHQRRIRIEHNILLWNNVKKVKLYIIVENALKKFIEELK